MTKYIEKQAAIEALGEEPENWIDAEYDLGTQDQWIWDVEAIKSVPPADVRPVVRGFNKNKEWPSLFECSVCGWGCDDTTRADTSVWNFCPNCGAEIMQAD